MANEINNQARTETTVLGIYACQSQQQLTSLTLVADVLREHEGEGMHVVQGHHVHPAH